MTDNTKEAGSPTQPIAQPSLPRDFENESPTGQEIDVAASVRHKAQQGNDLQANASSGQEADLEASLQPRPAPVRPKRGRFGPLAAQGMGDSALRSKFVRKVFLVIAAQLIVAASFICIFLFVKKVKDFVQAHPPVHFIAYGVYAVTLLVLVFSTKKRRAFPYNFIALGVLTLALSYLVATLASFYDAVAVLIAVAIIVGVSLAIALVVSCSSREFSFFLGIAVILISVISLFAFAMLIVWLVGGSVYIMQVVYGGLAALLIGCYLAVDIQIILAGTLVKLSEEEYISGAVQIYVDIVYLFLMIFIVFAECLAK